MSSPVVIVVAAGPGVSGSVARLLASQGWRVGLLGSDEAAVRELADRVLLARRADTIPPSEHHSPHPPHYPSVSSPERLQP